MKKNRRKLWQKFKIFNLLNQIKILSMFIMHNDHMRKDINFSVLHDIEEVYFYFKFNRIIQSIIFRKHFQDGQLQ